MAAKTDLSKLNCSLARALAAAGDWWTLLIVRDAFLGLSRFGEFQKSLGIARNILADRLEGLVASGIFVREGSGARPRYLLTEKGREMLPALLALMQWGDKWESDGKPPMLAVDESGRPLPAVRAEDSSGRPISTRTIRFRAGPGATRRTRLFFDMLAEK